MRHFLSAIGFLTILPAGGRGEFAPARMAAWFPAVGLLLGGMLSAFDLAAGRLFSPPLCSLLSVLLLAVLSGALHLDGLADTADGLFSHRGRERALEIMKDSRVGVMGLVAVVFTAALKWGALAEIGHHRALVLVAVPGFSRAGLLAAMRRLPYGRPAGGTAGAFFARPIGGRAFFGLLPLAPAVAWLGATGLVLLAAWGLWTALLLGFYRRRMGCVTGDMLGAMVETTEAVLFLVMAAATP